MNWRWKHIIICAVVGLALGIFNAFSNGSEMALGTKIGIIAVMPLSINFLYWGWRTADSWLRKLNLFLVMSLGKWVIYFFVKMIISVLIGYVSCPIAIYKAIKNQD